MVDWKSPAEIQKDAVVFSKLTHAFIGVYVWEWVISLDFDWQVITGKKPFKWPMIFYFLNRYLLLFDLIGAAVLQNVTVKIDCQALNKYIQILSGTAFGLASVNLSLRTMAVWSRKWYIVYPLVILILGHFAAMLHGILLTVVWVPGQGCIVTHTDIKSFAAGHIYTMTFDFIVMALTAIKLVLASSGNRSRLMQLIFQDGLIYFIVAFATNSLVTIFMLLNLNSVMSLMANFPALVLSTIVACRVVRRLSNFSPSGPEMFPPSAKGASTAYLPHTSGGRPNFFTNGVSKGGVHVQMESIQQPASEKTMVAECNTSGQWIKGDHEAQVEFRRPP